MCVLCHISQFQTVPVSLTQSHFLIFFKIFVLRSLNFATWYISVAFLLVLMYNLSYLNDKNSKRELAGNSVTIEDWILCESKFYLDNITNKVQTHTFYNKFFNIGAISANKTAEFAPKIFVRWFESLTTLENTHWHLFNFNLIFSIKKAQNPCGLWVYPTCIY